MRTVCYITFVIFTYGLCFGAATFFLMRRWVFPLSYLPCWKTGSLLFVTDYQGHTLLCLPLPTSPHGWSVWVTTISWNSLLLSGYFFHSTASTVPNQPSVYKYKEDKNLLQPISTLITGTKLHNAQSTCGKTTPFDRTRASQTQYRKLNFTHQLMHFYIQGGPKVGIQYTIYCIPTFGPPCVIKY